MEKALEILNHIYVGNSHTLCIPSKFSTLDVFNAIQELEEAMNRTCEGCEYLDGVICRHDRGLYCVRQFEADYFKSKDNA